MAGVVGVVCLGDVFRVCKCRCRALGLDLDLDLDLDLLGPNDPDVEERASWAKGHADCLAGCLSDRICPDPCFLIDCSSACRRNCVHSNLMVMDCASACAWRIVRAMTRER